MRLKYIIDKNYDKQFVENAAIKKQFDGIYQRSLKYLKYTQKLYQLSWDEIGQKFSRYIEKETGYKWFYPTYCCVISIIHQGISNWGYKPKIIRWWKENPYSQRRITAHELIVSHYFEIYRRHYHEYNLTDGQVWALAEIAAFALTFLTTTAKKFWPWDFAGYFINHNYPQIVNLQQRLKTTFLKKKNFDEYIEKGIKLIRRYKNIKP